MPTLTIYTPTYNRATLLPRVYESLCRQTCKDFVWLVIDDGSTDGTRELIQDWIDKRRIAINYIYKENGGLHTGYNAAFQAIDTELCACIDSDDYMPDDAVMWIINTWQTKTLPDCGGLIGLDVTENGDIVGKKLPDVEISSYGRLLSKNQLIGDKKFVYYTPLMKGLRPFPEFQGERIVPTGFIHAQIPENRPFILVNRPFCVVEYQENGMTSGIPISRFKNANGFREAAKQFIINSQYTISRVKGHLSYIAFSIILKDTHYLKDSPKPLISLLLTPVGFGVYLWFLHQKRTIENLEKRMMVIQSNR